MFSGSEYLCFMGILIEVTKNIYLDSKTVNNFLS